MDEYCTLFPTTPGCEIYGCTDPLALNYNQMADIDNGSCIYDDCICFDLWDPVCGENGITYGNTCEADCYNVEYIDGACEDPCASVDCMPGYECINGDCIPSIGGCTWENEEWYPFGFNIQAECNTCVCTPGFNPNEDGVWACTMMACEEGCLDDGQYYETGFELLINDCQYITCESQNNWSEINDIEGCNQTTNGCEYENQIYPFGSSIEQNCNSCLCQEGFNAMKIHIGSVLKWPVEDVMTLAR